VSVKQISNLLSYLFHPLILVTLSLIYSFGLSSFEFAGTDMFLMTAQVLLLTYLFPAFTIVIMKKLGLIKDIHMKDRMDRIGPLIATMSFYLWAYINFQKSGLAIPDLFKISLLGTSIALGIAFILTIFTKISLHAIGMGGMVALVLVAMLKFGYMQFDISLFDYFKNSNFDLTNTQGFQFSQRIFFPIMVVVAGAVGMARLYLDAHTTDQLAGGYLVGIISMLIATGIIA